MGKRASRRHKPRRWLQAFGNSYAYAHRSSSESCRLRREGAFDRFTIVSFPMRHALSAARRGVVDQLAWNKFVVNIFSALPDDARSVTWRVDAYANKVVYERPHVRHVGLRAAAIAGDNRPGMTAVDGSWGAGPRARKSALNGRRFGRRSGGVGTAIGGASERAGERRFGPVRAKPSCRSVLWGCWVGHAVKTQGLLSISRCAQHSLRPPLFLGSERAASQPNTKHEVSDALRGVGVKHRGRLRWPMTHAVVAGSQHNRPLASPAILGRRRWDAPVHMAAGAH